MLFVCSFKPGAKEGLYLKKKKRRYGLDNKVLLYHYNSYWIGHKYIYYDEKEMLYYP